MQTNKVSETHKITLKEPFVWDYNPHNLGSYKTSPFLQAIEDIAGVIDVEYDSSAATSFFVTIDTNYPWEDLLELIRTLSNE